MKTGSHSIPGRSGQGKARRRLDGRKEIRLAEQEMPGLMALRERYGGRSRSRAKIMGSLHMTSRPPC
jgi:S-adenosylhomocysteine hydrolase